MPSEQVLKEVQEASKSAGAEKEERGRSTILFPYLPLDDAIQVAKGVHNVGGTHCQVDQLAAQLKLPADASMFRLKLNTARIFGLITHAQGIVTLSTLGTRICDPQQEAAARAESFLAVPLYLKIYEQFKGANLPPMSGLETAIGNMGVAAKQKSNARQVFQRAATQAGFFAFGPGRLVYPTIKGSVGGAAGAGEVPHPPADFEKASDKPKNNGGGGGDDGGDGLQHPFITGLIKTLPKPEGPWPVDKRAKWLQAALHVFDLIYEEDTTGSRVEIKVLKDSVQ